jgi:hypothetical protein
MLDLKGMVLRTLLDWMAASDLFTFSNILDLLDSWAFAFLMQ